MILPTKRIDANRALITVGGRILRLLTEPKTISRLWAELKRLQIGESGFTPLTFDWFVLALDFLYAVEAIEIEFNHIKLAKK